MPPKSITPKLTARLLYIHLSKFWLKCAWEIEVKPFKAHWRVLSRFLDKDPLYLGKASLPTQLPFIFDFYTKSWSKKVSLVKSTLGGHSQLIHRLHPYFWTKTPCISEKRPLPPDQHSDSHSTPKTGLGKVGLVKSLVGWQCPPLCLWTNCIFQQYPSDVKWNLIYSWRQQAFF